MWFKPTLQVYSACVFSLAAPMACQVVGKNVSAVRDTFPRKIARDSPSTAVNIYSRERVLVIHFAITPGPTLGAADTSGGLHLVQAVSSLLVEIAALDLCWNASATISLA